MTTPESYIGKSIDFDKAYGAQCVDLANQYAADNGLGRFTGGSAADMFGQNPDKLTWVKNTPDGVPPSGAIVVWNRGIGPYGHIAIVRAGSNTNTLCTVDQNWNGHAYCEAVNHNYNAVIGWGIPKVAAPSGGNQVADVTVTIDELRIIHSELEGWPLADTHAGKFDAQFNASWGGHGLREVLWEKWNKNQGWRAQRQNALNYFAQKAQNDKTISDLQAQVKSQQDQIAKLNAQLQEKDSAPVSQDQAAQVVADTVKPSVSFIQRVIQLLTGKK